MTSRLRILSLLLALPACANEKHGHGWLGVDTTSNEPDPTYYTLYMDGVDDIEGILDAYMVFQGHPEDCTRLDEFGFSQ